MSNKNFRYKESILAHGSRGRESITVGNGRDGGRSRKQEDHISFVYRKLKEQEESRARL